MFYYSIHFSVIVKENESTKKYKILFSNWSQVDVYRWYQDRTKGLYDKGKLKYYLISDYCFFTHNLFKNGIEHYHVFAKRLL